MRPPRAGFHLSGNQTLDLPRAIYQCGDARLDGFSEDDFTLRMMNNLLAIAIVTVFVVLALVHAYWAFGGRITWLAVVPEVKGRPAFTPSALATFVVAGALFACAGLIAATAGVLVVPVSPSVLTWLTFALALVLLLRAVGDFRLVGFFKRVRGTNFARLDTAVYSPLCLALSLGVFIVALDHHA